MWYYCSENTEERGERQLEVPSTNPSAKSALLRFFPDRLIEIAFDVFGPHPTITGTGATFYASAKGIGLVDLGDLAISSANTTISHNPNNENPVECHLIII